MDQLQYWRSLVCSLCLQKLSLPRQADWQLCVASRVGPSETPFPHRHVQCDFGIYSVWTDPSDSEKNVKWTRGIWEAMQPFVEQSVYVNNLGEEGDERVRAAYGPNYERLAALKNKYDPTNFFRLNQNIRPTQGAPLC